MFAPLNRVQPRLHAGNMRTFEASAPLATHWRVATCAEVECEHHQNGWATAVDTTTQRGRDQADYIRAHSGRHFIEREAAVPGCVVFEFAAGQRCFREHRAPLARPPILIRRGGDWRGNPTGEHFQHTRIEHWFEDLSENYGRTVDDYLKG